jgi:hypothetical protein
MVKISLCFLLLGLLIFNQTQAQVSYAVPVSVDQSQLCQQIVGLKDRLENFSVHPNPATDQIYISSLTDGNLHFCNPAGAVILSILISAGTSTLDVRQLKQGLYILRLEAAHKQWHVRLVIQ